MVSAIRFFANDSRILLYDLSSAANGLKCVIAGLGVGKKKGSLETPKLAGKKRAALMQAQ